MTTEIQEFSPLSEEQGRARRKNSVAIALVLFCLVTLFYAVTMVQLQGNVAKRMEMGNKTSGTVQVQKTVAPEGRKASDQSSSSNEKRAK